MLTRSRYPSLLLFALLGLASAAAQAQSLAGSKASLARASRAARQHDYTYLRTGSQVHEFARRGLLVRLAGNSDYRVADVSFPYARPEVKTFVERLSEQYRSACGERLVVTSLTRPTSRQPRNASPLSVHPTGMAVDLRRSGRPACRAYLEKTLLTLEGRGVLEATRENHPPHYHVSLYPAPYKRYLASRGVNGGETGGGGEVARARYRVRGGDSLWEIAKRHGTSVDRLKRANGMRSSRLKPGQVLEIPAR
jgi:nucleoid-associated protein YgaU